MTESHSVWWLDATGQRWKLRLLLTAAGACTAGLVGTFLFEDDVWFSRSLWLCVAALPVTLLCIWIIRCRVCDELVMVWAIKKGDWLNRIDALRACPNCGARTNDGFHV